MGVKSTDLDDHCISAGGHKNFRENYLHLWGGLYAKNEGSMLFQNTPKYSVTSQKTVILTLLTYLLVKMLYFSWYDDATCSLMEGITLLQQWSLLFLWVNSDIWLLTEL
jgi:hypothetical protein